MPRRCAWMWSATLLLFVFFPIVVEVYLVSRTLSTPPIDHARPHQPVNLRYNNVAEDSPWKQLTAVYSECTILEALHHGMRPALWPLPTTVRYGAVSSHLIHIHEPTLEVYVSNKIISRTEPEYAAVEEQLHRLLQLLERRVVRHGPLQHCVVDEASGRAALEEHGSSRAATLHFDVRIDIEEGAWGVPMGGNERYTLDTSVGVVSMRAETIHGVRHAFTTLLQLVVPHTRIPDVKRESIYLVCSGVHIEDEPRFGHRGLLIDTGRTFYSIPFLESILDGMAALKLNVLHWHLTDDQSFPIALTSHPELAEAGAGWLGFIHNNVPQEVGKSYSVQDIQHILAHAARRGIRVRARKFERRCGWNLLPRCFINGAQILPELDVPGHCRSWGQADPELVASCPDAAQRLARNMNRKGQYTVNVPLDISRAKTMNVLKDVIEEVSSLFPDPMFHIGFDEPPVPCWEEDTELRARMQRRHGIEDIEQYLPFFLEKVLQLFSESSTPKNLVFWNEAFLMNVVQATHDTQFVAGASAHHAPIIHSWISKDVLQRAVDAGFQVISSFGWYLDNAPGMSCATWLECYENDALDELDDPLDRVLGGEACAWELSESAVWSREGMDQVPLFRRFGERVWGSLPAIAERLWSSSSVTSVESARSRIPFVLELMDKTYEIAHVPVMECIDPPHS